MSVVNSDAGSRAGSGSVPPPPPPPPKKPNVSPQKAIDKFWKNFNTKYPGKPFTVLPDNLYAKRAAVQAARDPNPSKNAVASYEQAAATAKAKVEKIARDCRRLNQKYKDPHFDIEFDFMQWQWGITEDCLVGLDGNSEGLRPMSVKRVEVYRRSSTTCICFRQDRLADQCPGHFRRTPILHRWHDCKRRSSGWRRRLLVPVRCMHTQ